MFTCVIRYTIEPDKLEQFREYARAWMLLIRRYGGVHHGYFLPGANDRDLPRATFSFPDIGRDGPPNIAVALFSFPTIEAYDNYRRDVADDEECRAATAKFSEAKCFSSYDRTFLVPMFE
jgi:hypothetical protein